MLSHDTVEQATAWKLQCSFQNFPHKAKGEEGLQS